MIDSAAVDRAVAAALARSAARVVVGYSGGLDSTVLLRAAAEQVSVDRLVALHVNHGLSAHAGEWQRHCEAVSGELGIEFRSVRVTLEQGNVEAAARKARYAAFAAHVAPPDVLWLGHHRDDQSETLLWRFLRGADLAALSGVPKERPLGAARLIRPLLGVSRAAIVAWAHARGVRWIEDESNADIGFDRNFLRRDVLPMLRARWPDLDVRLANAAERLAAEAALLHDALDARLASFATAEALPLEIVAAPGGLALLRRWLASHGVVGVGERMLREAVRQAAGAGDRHPEIRLDARRSLQRHAGGLYLVTGEATAFEPRAWRLDAPFEAPPLRLRARRGGAGLRADLERVIVRPRCGGERLRPAGRGGSRSVKQLLHEAAVKPWWRRHHPLLYVEDRLIAVPGVAIDEAFAETGPHAWQIDVESCE